MKPFDPTKPVRTRAGHPARIVVKDRKSDFPILTLVTDQTEREYVDCHSLEGISIVGVTNYDLENIPVKGTVKGFANIYSEQDVRVHATLERAKSNASSGLLARVPVEIEYTEGEGL